MAEPVSSTFTAAKAMTLTTKVLPQIKQMAKKKLPLFEFMSGLGIAGKLESFRDIYYQSLVDFEQVGKHTLLLQLLKKTTVYDTFQKELYERDRECVLLELNAQIAIDPELSFLQGELVEDEADQFRQVLASNIQKSRDPREAETANTVKDIYKAIQELRQNVIVAPAETLLIIHTKHIEQIASLRASNQHHAVITLLLRLKEEEWTKLSDELKFKVQLNLGISYLELGELELAAACLIDLLQYDFKREEAYAFAAIGYGNLKNDQQARHYAQLALEHNPDAANAYLVLLGAEEAVTPKSVSTIIPESMLKYPEVGYAIGKELEKSGYMAEAFEYYESALEKADRNSSLHYHLMADIAGLKLHPYSDQDFGLHVALAAEDKEQIRQAISLLDEAWKYYKDTDLRTTQWYVLLNRGIAYRCAGKMEQAKKDFQMALGVKEHFDIYRNLQVLAEYTGESAASYLQNMANIAQSSAEKMEVIFYELVYLFRDGKYDDALQRIEAINLYPDWHTERKFRIIQVDCMILVDKLLEAMELAEQLVVIHPQDSVPYYLKGRVFDAQGNREKTLENVGLAMQYTIHQDKSFFLGPYYQLLYKNEDYGSIIQQLDEKAVTSRFSTLTEILLRALIKKGNHKRAEELASTLHKLYPDEPFLTDLLSYLQEYHGHLEEAISTVRAYLSSKPEDVIFRLKSAFILLKLGCYEDAAIVLDGISWEELQKLSLQHQFAVASAYIQVNRVNEAFDLAYRIRGANLHDLAAHEAYIYFSVGYRDKQNNPSAAPNTVEVDSYVTYVTEKGADTILITRSPSGVNDVKPDSRIGAALLGKKVEEEVDLGRERAKVIAIVSRYSHAFQESLGVLTKRAAEEETFISSFRLNEGESVLEKFRPMFDLLDRKEGWDKQVDGLYLQRKATIGSIASICGMNPIQYWGRLISDPDLGVLCTQDYQSAIDGLSGLMGNQPVLVDLIAVLTLHQIDAVDLLSHLKGRCFIPQRVLDEIETEIMRLKDGIEDDTQSVAKIKGHYHSIVTSSRLKKKWVARYRRTLELLKDCCEIVYPNYPEDAKIKEENDRLLGTSSSETLLLAQQQNYLVYSDDALLLELSQTTHQLKGISTVVFLQYLKTHMRAVDEQQRDAYHVELIKLNYRWISANSSTLYKVYDFGGFELSPVFKNACQVLNGYDDRVSATIISGFLYEVYANSQLGEKRDFVAQYVAAIYLTNRPGESSKRTLVSHLKAKFILMPLQLNKILQIVESYK